MIRHEKNPLLTGLLLLIFLAVFLGHRSYVRHKLEREQTALAVTRNLAETERLAELEALAYLRAAPGARFIHSADFKPRDHHNLRALREWEAYRQSAPPSPSVTPSASANTCDRHLTHAVPRECCAPSISKIYMSKQYNKTIKKKRRIAYLKRKKARTPVAKKK